MSDETRYGAVVVVGFPFVPACLRASPFPISFDRDKPPQDQWHASASAVCSAPMPFEIVHKTDPLESGPPLRVLHVVDADAAFRLGPLIGGLLRGLHERNIHPTVLTDDPPEIVAAVDGAFPVAGVHALTGWRTWRFEKRVLARIETPEVVHLWGVSALPRIAPWTRRLGLPLVIYVSAERDIHAVQHAGIHTNERLLAASQSLRHGIEGLGPDLAGAVELFTPGVDVDQLTPRTDQTPPTPGVVWVGAWSEQDALQLLVEAVGLLDRQGVDLQVALVGHGPQRHAAWRRMREQRMDHRFSGIEGPGVSTLAVQGADILVTPTRQDAVQLMPLMAMARGAHVVCSRDQTLEWFVEGDSSLHFAPGSAKELAYQLTRVLEKRNEVSGLSESATHFVRQRYPLGDRFGALERIYRTVAQVGPTERSRA